MEPKPAEAHLHRSSRGRFLREVAARGLPSLGALLLVACGSAPPARSARELAALTPVASPPAEAAPQRSPVTLISPNSEAARSNLIQTIASLPDGILLKTALENNASRFARMSNPAFATFGPDFGPNVKFFFQPTSVSLDRANTQNPVSGAYSPISRPPGEIYRLQSEAVVILPFPNLSSANDARHLPLLPNGTPYFTVNHKAGVPVAEGFAPKIGVSVRPQMNAQDEAVLRTYGLLKEAGSMWFDIYRNCTAMKIMQQHNLAYEFDASDQAGKVKKIEILAHTIGHVHNLETRWMATTDLSGYLIGLHALRSLSTRHINTLLALGDLDKNAVNEALSIDLGTTENEMFQRVSRWAIDFPSANTFQHVGDRTKIGNK
jgi:hypothetical protein